jgi:phosphoglycolate phosphatase/pyrophosphatase PpaX
MRRFSLDPKEVLIVDDLKPAVLMAHSAGVDIAAAGWGHQIPEITEYMKSNCTYYCPTVSDLESVVLGDAGETL